MMKNSVSVFIVILLTVGCNVQQPVNNDIVTQNQLKEGFINPPDSVKPWVYWYWISDNNTREGITKDLEAMREVGIGEALIGNIGYEGMPYGKDSILTEGWWLLIEHAVREGKRTGVNIGLFNSPGWSQSGGPWVRPEEAMRYLTSVELKITGGKKICQKLPSVPGFFQDVRTIAYPEPQCEDSVLNFQNTVITSIPQLDNIKYLADRDTATACLFRKAGDRREIIFDFEPGNPFIARSLSVYPAEIPFAADIDVQIPDNNSYRSIRKFRFDRSNPRINVGPVPSGPVTVSLPEIKSRKFRLVLSNFSLSNYLTSRPNRAADAGLSEITFSSLPKVEKYIEKQLGKMCQTPFPLWNAYLWDQQDETGEPGMKIDPGNVIDLTENVSSDGTLTWDAPAGRWIIMRTVASLTGARNAQAAPYAIGWEVDKMNRNHLKHHFDTYIGELLRRMPAEDRTALRHVVLDSYEQGSQNWTDGMIEDFKERFGYSPVPWFPVLSGRIVASADQSDRFLWDLRRFVSDRIAYDYVGGFRDLCQEKGLRIWLENYGHWGFPSEFLMYGGQSHDVAGEFWNEGELGNIECRAASSAAHIYGKRLVSAESYTSAGLAFQRYPAMLKKRGDWSYTEGVNQVILHLYIHQAYEDKNPGINAWFGTEFNRKNTWFKQSKYWIDYQRRCMFMLRRGLAVNDVCYFIGEDVPKMTGARIPELPKGYSYDYINAEVILNRLTVKNGELVLPDGMSYKLMVLPPLETIRPEVIRRIRELADEGAVFYGPEPLRSPSLRNYPEADKEVKMIVEELWNENNGNPGRMKGRIFSDRISLQEVMNTMNVHPDVSFPDGIPLLWIHRRMKDADIYFITNQGDNKIVFDASFRITGKQPELWDPLDGMIRDLPDFKFADNGTTVPLNLGSTGSTFVIFRKKAGDQGMKEKNNFPEPETVVQINSPWEVRFDRLRGGPENNVIMTGLEDWSSSSDEKVRYYSGSAVYRNTFTLNEIPSGHQLYVDLGKVNVMAEVKVNGKSAGGAWTAPWRVDVTNFVKKGENTIEIEVVNNWINRLIGDSKLPEGQRITWVNENPAKPDMALQSSGLGGPVRILSVKY